MPRAPQEMANAAAPDPASGATTGTGTAAGTGDAPPAPLDAIDSGVVIDDSPHMMLITACWIDRRGCLRAQPSPPPAGSTYRVVFGGGTGSLRTRGQAMADLYGAIRDRTQAGEHLAAAPHHVGDPPADDAQEPVRPRSHGDEDPIVEAAFKLMAEVDRGGELTIDSLPRRAPSSCKLALGSRDLDAGEPECLVEGAGPGVETRPARGPGAPAGTGRTGRH